jgi:WD40 repeat protein
MSPVGFVRVVLAVTVALLCHARGELWAKDTKPVPAKGGPPKLDDRGDPLPEGAVARIGTVRFRHLFASHIAFSANGKVLLSNGLGGIRFWDAATGKELPSSEAQNQGVTAIEFSRDAKAFSPDGKVFAAESSGWNVELWDAKTRQSRGVLRGHKSHVKALVFAPDGKTLFSGSFDTTVRFWDVAAGRELRCLGSAKEDKDVSGEDPLIQSLAVAPDGKTVAAGRQDGWISVWDTATGQQLLRWKADRWAIDCLAFSPDSKTLASGGRCHRIRLWDSKTGKRLDPFTEPTVRPSAILFSPDGRFLAVNDDWMALCILDTANGNESVSVEMSLMSLSSVAVSPDGSTVAFAERTFARREGEMCRVRLLDVATGKEKKPFKWEEGILEEVAFWPQGETLTCSNTFGEFTTWNLATGKEVKRWKLPAPQGTAGVAFSPDGRRFARDGDEDQDRFRREKFLSLWDSASQKKLRSFGEAQDSHRSLLRFSPDGKTLASVRRLHGDAKPTDVTLWEVATGKERCVLKQKGREVTCLAISPDGSLIATAARKTPWIGPPEPICLWNADTGEEVGSLPGHVSIVEALAFSPDGKLLASGCDSTILLWDPWRLVPDRRPPADKLAADRLNELWADLKHDDAPRAHKAIAVLAKHPNESVPFLRRSIFPGPAPEPKVVARLIGDLDNEDFAVRDKASAELARLGFAAGPALRKALEGKPSAEARRHLKELTDRLEERASGPEKIRMIRVVETLERIGTPDARKLLQDLQAGGAWSAADEAKLSLERLARRAALSSP